MKQEVFVESLSIEEIGGKTVIAAPTGAQYLNEFMPTLPKGIVSKNQTGCGATTVMLENEENLFDLGLYIGLAGTVFSLILLTVGIVTASLMAAYASTLFGILFTALIKIMHVRRYKRTLLIAAAAEE